jgi:transposase InsO family protein
MCSTLEVSRSGYYAWRDRPPSARARANENLRCRIRAIHEGSGRTYGSPRIADELRDEGIACGEHRVARLMRQEGLKARWKPRFRVTTRSEHRHPTSPNVLDRAFEAERPDTRWVGDITYIPTFEGWLYLAVLLDLHSRRVVGWATSDSLSKQLAIDALQMALGQRDVSPGLIHHTDRGSQYASNAYQRLLERQRFTGSMSRKGNCYDNAVAESFFATLKKELVHRTRFRTRAEARSRLFEYIELFYNSKRRHSALGNLSPAEYERRTKIA